MIKSVSPGKFKSEIAGSKVKAAVAALALSFLAAISLSRMSETTQYELLFFWVALAGLDYYWIRSSRMTARPRSIVFGLLLACGFVFGSYSANAATRALMGNSPGLDSPLTYAYIIMLAPTLIAAAECFANACTNGAKPDAASKEPLNEAAPPLISFSLKRVLVCVGILFVVWLLLYLAFFPGVYGYDSVYQMAEIEGGALTKNNTALHMFILTACMQIGNLFGGGATACIAVYSFIQMTVFAVACGSLVSIIESTTIRRIGLAYFALCPVFGLFSVSVTKDVCFATFFVFSIVSLVALRDHKVGGAIGFCISCALCLALRSNAVYAYVVLLVLAGVVALRQRGMRFTAAAGALAAIPLVAFLMFDGPICAALGLVNNVAIRDSLSVPLQQLARVYQLDPDELTQEQKDMIDQLISTHYDYWPAFADPVKVSLDSIYLEENREYVISQYLAIGLKAPLAYTDSFVINSHGYWYPDEHAHEIYGDAYHPYMETQNTSHDRGDFTFVDRDSKLPLLERLVTKVVDEHVWEYIPVAAPLLGTGSVIWLLFLFLLQPGLRRCRPLALGTAFCMAYWGTLLLGPCVLARYILPLLVLAPILVLYSIAYIQLARSRGGIEEERQRSLRVS